jgi:hypothetical protein
MANVDPRFVALNGADPVAFILSANVNRRHLSKGQRAMAVAMAVSETDTDVMGRDQRQQLAADSSVSVTRIAQANSVRKHARDLTDEVLAGTLSLDEAYAEARERKASRAPIAAS